MRRGRVYRVKEVRWLAVATSLLSFPSRKGGNKVNSRDVRDTS